MTKRFLASALVFAVVSCTKADSRANIDSSLARDLALANQVTPNAEFKDTALAPATKTTKPPRSTAPAAKAEAPQTQPIETPVTSAPTPVQPSAPAAAPFRGIPAGATFALTTKAAVCTTNLPGDKITATVAADIVGENGAVIPAGSTVVVEVAEVTPGDKPENASVTLRIRSVIVNDQPVTVPSDVTVTSPLERQTQPRDKGADRKKVIGGVVAGAIVGQILGKNTKSTIIGAAAGGAAGAAAAAATGTKYQACLPAGGTLRATTREAVPLTSGQ